ncbi:hypothetical protein C1Y63_01020 [Corynebacterium sp. 13CS0277]|uniref:lytic transglycosylase domain-containing protein n=1 Tax=Corynebacterium sp. 13CS0277 TaxID=2071994 RepID=UPI000D02D8CA|nr:lytic murein transglycosylase [Corynebacterium sp. 13CS0277]PRQ12405.1 hypothetical protein C1Y63_01020 [Corynebacterium sp. 13CS0277]
MTTGRTALRGCMITSVLALVLVAIAVAGALVLLGDRVDFTPSPPVPDDVPPAAAAAPPAIDISAPGRTADSLADWAAPIAANTGISPAAVRAYGNAQLIAERTWPDCHLNWGTLAGIGYVETRHGTYSGKLFGGSHLDEAGVATPTIIGVPLDGSPGFAEILDTDGGKWDGDTEYDRAVGPMQFIPETFRTIGIDANGDNEPDPNQIDDAAASAAALLCMGERDLATPQGWTKAIYAYNASSDYLNKVRDAAAHYARNEHP